jgi:hypothetical protein
METKSKTYVWIALAAIVVIAIIAVAFMPGGLVAKFSAAGVKSMSMTPMATKAFTDNNMLYLAVSYDTSMLKNSNLVDMKMSMPKDLFANAMDMKVYMLPGVSADNIKSLDKMKTMINSGNMLKLNDDFTLTSSGNVNIMNIKGVTMAKNVDKVMTFVMVGKMGTNMMGKDMTLIANMAKSGMMSTVTYKAAS